MALATASLWMKAQLQPIGGMSMTTNAKLTSNRNPCISQHGIFACSEEPIFFEGYINMRTGVRHVCHRNTTNETCGNDAISSCCSALITPWTIGTPVIAIAVEFALYGAYTVLFGICMSLLSKHKQAVGQLFNLIQIVVLSVLFILATVSLVVNTIDVVVSGLGAVNLTPNSYDLRRFYIARLALLFVANVITDIILIWRCYSIWHQRIRVIVVPAIICLANNIVAVVNFARYLKELSAIWDFLLGETGSDLFLVYILWTVLTNIMLTSMIAGRIWYISRQAMASLGKSSINRMCRTVLAITLESGMIYPAALLIYASGVLTLLKVPQITSASTTAITSNKYNQLNLIPKVMQYVLNQFAGIAPTLIVVCTKLGVSVENVESTVESLRAATGSSGTQTSTCTSRDISSLGRTESPQTPHQHNVLGVGGSGELGNLEAQKKNDQVSRVSFRT
ncbi:hypothetical protein PM082_000320 [Marasmius tenuissimus]|nr:hypothetical protein PM082_000320 [Marasmius tenuissimus]